MLIKGLPNEGDLVFCEVTNIQPNAAFAKLTEYENLEGMIHISEVSSSWIRNIKNHVKEGKKIVCKVIRVDLKKRYVSLSIRRVGEAERSGKFESIRREKKTVKMLERAAAKLNLTTEDADKKITKKLVKDFAEVYFAFEEAARHGAKALVEKGIPEDWAKAIEEIAKESITFPQVTVSGVLTLQSNSSNGVEVVKKILAEMAKEYDVQVHYISAPKYKISVVDSDYKIAERRMKEAVDYALGEIKKSKGAGDFLRKEK